jgi:uncharacterized protein with FMN-binding domain
MNRHRSIPFVLGATVAAVPAVAQPAIATAAAVRTYYGPVVRMPFGPVQVGIKVSGSRVTVAWASGPTNNPICKLINRHALPILDREAVQAQTVSGVHRVSGASLSSGAFKKSLAGAMAKARLAGAYR